MCGIVVYKFYNCILLYNNLTLTMRAHKKECDIRTDMVQVPAFSHLCFVLFSLFFEKKNIKLSIYLINLI